MNNISCEYVMRIMSRNNISYVNNMNVALALFRSKVGLLKYL